MKNVFIKAGITTIVSVLVSLGICWAVLAAAGGRLDGYALAMCIVCPLVVAFPASAYTYNKNRKMDEALGALAAAHRELAAVHGRLIETARRDDLTGFLNRSAFIAAVEESRDAPMRGSLLLIDADNFKAINDTFGHLTGDVALRAMAEAIRNAVRDTDIKGRLGGEEFGVLIANVRPGEAHAMAEKVRQAVEAVYFRPDGAGPVRLTVSIGVATAPTGATFSELMSQADHMLYEAKGLGRNIVVADVPGAAAA